jgi:putative oxidoreductase
MNIILWIIQALLALVFLMAGFMKTCQPIKALAEKMSWVTKVPSVLVRLLGIAELLGAIGLILPALTHILSWLTILAAIGLALVMVGAIVLHAVRREVGGVGLTIVILILSAFVAYGRWILLPF